MKKKPNSTKSTEEKSFGMYDHKKIEPKWQKIWDKTKAFKAVGSTAHKKKFFGLIEFPFPSGDGLHVGHIRSNTAMDIIARKRRREGYDVLYPIGWDAFGLPTENYAIKTGIHPSVVSKKNSDTFRRQLKALGFSFDWSREIDTTDPQYYRWTQWIFLQFFKKGLAYKKKMTINWCPKDLIGLANEEVVDGCCERCGTLVEKRDKEQWMLAITKYAERLDKDLDTVDFLERIKIQQRNWIGKSEGAEIKFTVVIPSSVAVTPAQAGVQDGNLQNFKYQITNKDITVFTTRPDTLFGVTYVVLAPEHPYVADLLKDSTLIENADEVRNYIAKVKKETDIERTDMTREKNGVELRGVSASNPVNGEYVPVWIADYVLADYGTGAVMAVPAHDERDFLFAKKYDLPVKMVICPNYPDPICPILDQAYLGDGHLIDSDSFNGKKSADIKKEITEKAGGKWVTTFKLRDWIFSRQRYWGEPIPVVHCVKCGIVPVPEKDLPVKLPKVKNYTPTETGESPLAAISSWVNTICPQCVADKKKTKYLIFDFDGVLGDTWNAMNTVKVDMGMSKTIEEAGLSAVNHFDKKPIESRSEKITQEELEVRKVWISEYGKLLAKSKFGLFTGFISEIKKLKNVKLAVVSAGSSHYVVPILKKSGLKFSHVLTYEDHASKEEKVEKVCKDWGIDVRDAFYFTDTKADVLELETIMDKNKILGCAWGYHGYERLREILPEHHILKEFKDIHKVLNTKCVAKRETDTMPNWAGSSWYYIAYCIASNLKTKTPISKQFSSPQVQKELAYWLSVDWYNGGMEHTTLHLLYSRFWHKFLFDLGVVPTAEPYKKRTSHGLILAQGGEKMSKSKGNVINPDGIVETVGADSLRLYEMFMGPFDQPIAWNTDNIAGVRRFIERVWKLREKIQNLKSEVQNNADKIIHKTIKKVSDDIEAMRFNTAISALMICLNELEKGETIDQKNYEVLLQLVAPFAPHITEELWLSFGHKESIHTSPWPQYDPNVVIETEMTIMLQVNGKIRGSVNVSVDTHKVELEKIARENHEIRKWTDGKEIIKVIVVPKKLVNIVISQS